MCMVRLKNSFGLGRTKMAKAWGKKKSGGDRRYFSLRVDSNIRLYIGQRGRLETPWKGAGMDRAACRGPASRYGRIIIGGHQPGRFC